jgi:hypothetical protein
MTSCILDAINSVRTQVSGITWDWSAVEGAEKPKPDKLFQKVLMWNNQLSRMKDGTGYLTAMPACYVEMRPENTTQLLENVTLSDVCWRMHVLWYQLDAGDDETMDQTLYAYTLRDAIIQAMVGFEPENCSTMFYTKEEQDYDHDNIYHYVVEFKTSFRDTKGSTLDPDQTRFIYTTPPTNLELETGFYDGEVSPVDPLITYIWKVCEVDVVIVETPDGSTITLSNGAVIPAQYALNLDGTVTIPYLASTPGINLVYPFLIGNQSYPNVTLDNTTGVLNNDANGGFAVGDTLNFNANLPLGVDS